MMLLKKESLEEIILGEGGICPEIQDLVLKVIALRAVGRCRRAGGHRRVVNRPACPQ